MLSSIVEYYDPTPEPIGDFEPMLYGSRSRTIEHYQLELFRTPPARPHSNPAEPAVLRERDHLRPAHPLHGPQGRHHEEP